MAEKKVKKKNKNKVHEKIQIVSFTLLHILYPQQKQNRINENKRNEMEMNK